MFQRCLHQQSPCFCTGEALKVALYDARYAEGVPFLEGIDGANAWLEGVIESPPEWGRPEEGNPNQPRRPPEFNPPQVRLTF